MMRNNGVMSEPALAPRNAFVGVLVVWAAALVSAIVIGIVAAEQWRVPWLIVAFGAMILLSFGTQLGYARTEGYIVRVAASVVGALIIMGIISVGFGLAALASA